MPLTTKQRNALPDSAFVYRKARKYPVPTKAQAKRAGIGERQRLGLHRNALSRAAQRKTSGTPSKVRSIVRMRSSGKIGHTRTSPSSPMRGRRRAPSTVLGKRRR